jgi:hypothetical protein
MKTPFLTLFLNIGKYISRKGVRGKPLVSPYQPFYKMKTLFYHYVLILFKFDKGVGFNYYVALYKIEILFIYLYTINNEHDYGNL